MDITSELAAAYKKLEFQAPCTPGVKATMVFIACPKCDRRMRVRTSKRIGDTQQQYLKCDCGYETSRAVPAASVWRRPGRATTSGS
jgi:predicted RNA-binding Zn-ribbon protein involved in translation (DUF1610 family)